MTEGEGASQEAPASPVAKTFVVYWAGDEGSLEYNHIVGSGLNDGLLFLTNDVGVEFIISMEFVMHVIVSNEP